VLDLVQLLQVEKRNKELHAKTSSNEIAMGGMAEANHMVTNESQNEDQILTPKTFELRKHGYLALARGLGSGIYETTGLTSQASGGIEIFGIQNRALGAENGDGTQNLRQSSIDTEPHTLDLNTVKEAKEGAIEIIQTYDADDALHLFLKDAEDEQLRKEALAAILPTSEFVIIG
jgi:hypothetical protein